MNELKQVDRKNLEDIVQYLQDTQVEKQIEFQRIEQDLKRVARCHMYLSGVLKTHAMLETPKHDSEEFLFFFKSASNNQIALVNELKPHKNFMPKMQRISIKDAQKISIKNGGGVGFVIERLYFGVDPRMRSCDLLVMCFKRFLFEEL